VLRLGAIQILPKRINHFVNYTTNLSFAHKPRSKIAQKMTNESLGICTSSSSSSNFAFFFFFFSFFDFFFASFVDVFSLESDSTSLSRFLYQQKFPNEGRPKKVEIPLMFSLSSTYRTLAAGACGVSSAAGFITGSSSGLSLDKS
jgi:hypothetical protein